MIRRLIRCAALAMLLLCSATAGSAAEGRSAPRDMAERLMSAPLPGRDAFDLAVRLRGLSTATPLAAPVPAAPLVTGFTDAFWILDQRTAQLFQSEATLRLVSPHAYWFVQTDMLDRAPLADLERSANVFETKTYPLIHQYFGTEPSPGVDGDAHIVLLLGNVPGVAAYFSSADAYPRAISPRSNEHEMIYVNLNSLRPGQTGFDATLTHELQHMAHFAHCPHQEGWIDEGAAELACSTWRILRTARTRRAGSTKARLSSPCAWPATKDRNRPHSRLVPTSSSPVGRASRRTSRGTTRRLTCS
jgi:hypothetical protein